jgi:hypothetical protein
MIPTHAPLGSLTVIITLLTIINVALVAVTVAY